MKHNINIIQSVWCRWRKPSRGELGAICSQNSKAQRKEAAKYAIVVFLCLGYTVSASAKIGETVPQLIKRFGNSYTVEPVRIGKKYKFRSENISVDAVVANDISVGETYFSDHPLTGNGEPPNDIVRAVLRTNVPRVRWIEIEAARYQADYALRSSDSAYIALLTYSGPQPEDVVWTITVARRENLSYLLPAIGSRPRDPLPPAGSVPPPNAQQRTPQKYQPSQQPTSSGTGFFVSDNGFLLTNYHVVRNGQRIVVLQTDSELDAKVVVVDPSNDLAVLKVDSPSTPIPLGNVHNVVLGDSVMTIGFPNVPLQGRSPKLTKGAVNSLCGFQDDPRIFQTSVQLQPGNSGGPLLDELGNAIGVTEATLNPLITLKAAGSIPQNVNYAVKISYAQLLLDTVPDLRNQLPPPATIKRDSAEVVSNACKSTVLILVWAPRNSGI